MHNVQIKVRKDSTWYTLPYMVIEVEVDQVVATWPNAWKVRIGSTQPITLSTSGKHATPKDKTKLHTETGTEKRDRKDTQAEAEKEPKAEKDKEQDLGGEQEMELKGLDGKNGDGAKSPCGTKRGI